MKYSMVYDMENRIACRPLELRRKKWEEVAMEIIELSMVLKNRNAQRIKKSTKDLTHST